MSINRDNPKTFLLYKIQNLTDEKPKYAFGEPESPEPIATAEDLKGLARKLVEKDRQDKNFEIYNNDILSTMSAPEITMGPRVRRSAVDMQDLSSFTVLYWDMYGNAATSIEG